ncbi:MAG TPA: nucleotidyl transferase AbiEii/AbiGii toxin family protein, partial [Candidatus Goldiibacteriota bacterium]|nr:nucleotidyl transferase AbiEii/AbiGii toxin family protein [Candidatus Goldiibacteriota bacterium]
METLLSSYPEKLKGFKRGILAEYLQCLILSYVFPLKKGDLRFIGGTAVRLGWGSGRFSEDIDFDG